MGVHLPGRGSARGRRGWRDAEISNLEYGAAIASLLALAALLLLSGCGDTGIKSVQRLAKATPSNLQFGKVAITQTKHLDLVVVNDGASELTVVGIEPLDGLSSDFHLPDVVPSPVPVGKSLTLPVAFTPSEERTYEGGLRILTNSAETPTLDVRVDGEGARPLVACTDRLDFDRIVLNTTKVLRITCVNVGDVDATLRLLGKEGEDAALFDVGMNLTSLDTAIPAGESLLVEVRYRALHLGEARARALFEVPGAANSSVMVDLVGEGFASDLYADPGCIHFGPVSPKTVATRTLRVHNSGNEKVIFQAPTIKDSSGVFGITGSVVGGVEKTLQELGAGEEAELTITFAPTAIGSYAGDVVLRSDDPINPRMEICLTGQGGGPDIMAMPTSVDFGIIARGMRATARVLISNGGTSTGGPLQLGTLRVEDPANFTVVQPTVTQLDPNDTPVAVEITFQPQFDGQFATALVIPSNDGDEPELRIPLRGESMEMPSCDYRVDPPALHFGNLQVGAYATLTTRLQNVGDEDCIFSSLAMAPGSDPLFALGAAFDPTIRLGAGEAITVPISLHATRAGSYSGALQFFVSTVGANQGNVPVTASASSGCLQAEPAALDFGLQRVSCPAVTRPVKIVNKCGVGARITSATLGAGAFSTGELELLPFPTPIDLLPNASAQLQVRYDALDEGHDGAPVQIASSSNSLSIAVHGAGTLSDERTDSFSQRQREAVDVLFVIDNSGSMMEEQNAIGQAFGDFMQYAMDQGIDYHIGVTTTGISTSGGGWSACPGGVEGGEGGRLFPANSERARIITPDTPNAAAVFAANVKVGICHWWEEGLEAAYRALSSPLVDSSDAPNTSLPRDGNLGFYRPDAQLSVIIVTDEDDHSPRDTSFYAGFFQNLKGAAGRDKIKVHGVLGNGCGTASGNGTRYSQVITATGGTTESICTSDWGESLANLAQSTFGFRLRFPLSGTPEGAITVRVDGAVVGEWSYDARANEVVFTEDGAPAPGSQVDITYKPACE